MSKHDVNVDELSERVWSVWSAYRKNQGFERGSISPSIPLEDVLNKRSPALVDSFFEAPVPSQTYIKMWVRLVLGSMKADDVFAAQAPTTAKSGMAVVMRSFRDSDSPDDTLSKVLDFMDHAPTEHKEGLSTVATLLRGGRVIDARRQAKKLWDAITGKVVANTTTDTTKAPAAKAPVPVRAASRKPKAAKTDALWKEVQTASELPHGLATSEKPTKAKVEKAPVAEAPVAKPVRRSGKKSRTM